MIEIGRLCVKIAGRDAGLKCAVVDDLGKGFVVVDGQTRRRKCNIKHLEPLKEKLNIKKNASHDEIVREFKKLKIEVKEKKPKKKAEKPKRQRKAKKETEAKEAKKAKEEKSEKKAKKQEKKSPKKAG